MGKRDMSIPQNRFTECFHLHPKIENLRQFRSEALWVGRSKSKERKITVRQFGMITLVGEWKKMMIPSETFG